ncbi:hypothetical protein ACFGVR_16490 [Mucilaginibacter sp. AW1-3]
MVQAQKNIQQPAEWLTTPSQNLNSKRYLGIISIKSKEQKAEDPKPLPQQAILNENFVRSYEDTCKVLSLLNESDIDVISARLKVETLNHLQIMLSIKQTKDLNDKIENVYSFIYELGESSSSENYNIDFYIIKATEHFNDKGIEKDGYIYKHPLTIN